MILHDAKNITVLDSFHSYMKQLLKFPLEPTKTSIINFFEVLMGAMTNHACKLFASLADSSAVLYSMVDMVVSKLPIVLIPLLVTREELTSNVLDWVTLADGQW